VGPLTLDLRVVEARLDQHYAEYLHEHPDVRALLSHCRALRAVLKDALIWIYDPPEKRARLVFERAVAVLEQVTD